jgi:hypothetical protein
MVAGSSQLLQLHIKDAFGNAATTSMDALSASVAAEPPENDASAAWMLALQKGWPQYAVQLRSVPGGGVAASLRSNISGTLQVLLSPYHHGIAWLLQFAHLDA